MTDVKKIKDPVVQYQDFEIQVGFPAENDKWTYQTIAFAETFNIAREVAYSIARQGLRMRYPQPENKRNEKEGWFVVSPETAKELSSVRWEKYTTEAVADRAIILATEMKVRSRVGNIINELRHIADESKNPKARAMIRQGILDTGRAVFQPLTAGDMMEIGLEMEPDYRDVLAEAQAIQGVEPIGEICPSCGEVHAGERLYSPAELMQAADAEWRATDDPIAEAIMEVEGLHA